ncbi:MAG: transcriptional repressor [Planctomycetes bacterium]|nr:transcriptional repressor [Planctomycetota bacterium]
MARTEQSPIERRLAHIKATVREAGIKLTHQRLEIFRELAATEEHPNAESLFEAVRERVPTVSLDTVYRTLAMLNELGLVKTIGQLGGGTRFDANIDQHHHFVCVSCGRIRDFESNELNRLQVTRFVKGLGKVLDAHVEVRGLCTECGRNQTDTRKPKSNQRNSR